MKPYTVSVEINKPRDEVVAAFGSEENLFKWQSGLVSVEPQTGTPGEVGCTTLLVYQDGGIELTETITKVDLPDELSSTCAWPGGMNTLVNRFIEVDSNTTRLEATCDYTFQKLSMKLVGMLMPSAFRKRHLAWLENFKALCETGADIRDRNVD